MESHSMQMYKAEPEMRQHPGAQSIGECVCEYWVSELMLTLQVPRLCGLAIRVRNTECRTACTYGQRRTANMCKRHTPIICRHIP
jgi:hypothetical protein